MADKQISEVPAAPSASTADLVLIYQGGLTKNLILGKLPVSTAVQAALDAKQDKTAATDFTASVPFDLPSRVMPEQAVTAPIAFTPNATGAADGAETVVSLVADGESDVTFAGFYLAGLQGYDNTAGRVNMIAFWRAYGRYFYGVTLGPIIAQGGSSAPVLTSLSLSGISSTGVNVSVTTDVANGTLYAICAATVADATAGQIKAGLNGWGLAATSALNRAVTTTGAQVFSITGLQPSTTYRVQCAQTGSSGQDSNVIRSIEFTTSP